MEPNKLSLGLLVLLLLGSISFATVYSWGSSNCSVATNGANTTVYINGSVAGSCWFYTTNSLSFEDNVIGGGGSGGYGYSGISEGGAGGAGGFIYNSSVASASACNWTLAQGAGGVAVTSATTNNGTASNLTALCAGTTSAAGGGFGGTGTGGTPGGGNGGSGGGAAGESSTYGAGNFPSTSPSQGNNGGTAYVSSNTNAGAGGGATTAAIGGGVSTVGGSGGNGANSSINGSLVCYAGGGAACGSATNGQATCGGGNPPSGSWGSCTAQYSGIAGTGGGGASGIFSVTTGGNGGSGAIFISFTAPGNTTLANYSGPAPTSATYFANGSTYNFSGSCNTSSGNITAIGLRIAYNGTVMGSLTANYTCGALGTGVGCGNNTNYSIENLTSIDNMTRATNITPMLTCFSSQAFANSAETNGTNITINDSQPYPDVGPLFQEITPFTTNVICSVIDADTGADIGGYNLSTAFGTATQIANSTSGLRANATFAVTGLLPGETETVACGFTDKGALYAQSGAGTETVDGNLTTCSNITTANYAYNVQNNITYSGGTCFNVTAANVTLLGNAFALTGNNATGSVGVNVSAFNASIQNINISQFRADVLFNNSQQSILNNDTLNVSYNSGYGIYLQNANLTVINASTINVTVTSTSYGIYGNSANNITIANGSLVTSAATLYGIYLNSNSDNWSVYNNVFNASGMNGAQMFYVGAPSDRFENVSANVFNLSSTGSSSGTVLTDDGANDTYSGNNLSSGVPNTYMVIFSNSANTTFTNNTVNGSGSGASMLSFQNHAELDAIINNQLNTSGGANGMIDSTSSNNETFANNTVFSATSEPLLELATTTQNWSVSNNTFHATAASSIGIYMAASTVGYNTVSFNVVNATQNAVNLTGSNNNTFFNNTFWASGIDVDLDAAAHNNSFYYNNFSGGSLLFRSKEGGANDNALNTTVSGIPYGNYWADIGILAINSNGTLVAPIVGLLGAQYPYNSTHTMNLSGNITDWGPLIPFVNPYPPSYGPEVQLQPGEYNASTNWSMTTTISNTATAQTCSYAIMAQQVKTTAIYDKNSNLVPNTGSTPVPAWTCTGVSAPYTVDFTTEELLTASASSTSATLGTIASRDNMTINGSTTISMNAVHLFSDPHGIQNPMVWICYANTSANSACSDTTIGNWSGESVSLSAAGVATVSFTTYGNTSFEWTYSNPVAPASGSAGGVAPTLTPPTPSTPTTPATPAANELPGNDAITAAYASLDSFMKGDTLGFSNAGIILALLALAIYLETRKKQGRSDLVFVVSLLLAVYIVYAYGTYILPGGFALPAGW